MPPFFWLRLGRYLLELLYAFAITTISFNLVLPLLRFLWLSSGLAVASHNPNHAFAAAPLDPLMMEIFWTWCRGMAQYMCYAVVSGRLLQLIDSHNRADEAWQRSRAMAIERKRASDLKIEKAERYIREAKEAHHIWCAEMLEDVRRQEAALREERERFEAEKEEFRARAQGAGK